MDYTYAPVRSNRQLYAFRYQMVVSDWGSASFELDVSGGEFFGGTPVYAGPSTFKHKLTEKDLFSFGRMAMELMLEKSGTESFLSFIFLDNFESEYKVFLGLTFYPIEGPAFLERFRRRLCPFIKAIQGIPKCQAMNANPVFDEIIRAARSQINRRSGQITKQLSAEWHQFIRTPMNQTLNREHDELVAANLK